MFTVDPTSSVPIYQQLVEQVKEGVLKGTLTPGDRLPSVRELATMITINPNTIQKAYQELERQNVIETIRGRGTYVARNYKAKPDEERLALVAEMFRRSVVEARYAGLSSEEIITLVKSILVSYGGRESVKDVKD